MNINFTLVIQIFHFFIAYFLLDRFLIRHVLALIHKNEQEVEKAKKAVDVVEQQIKKKELLKEEQWQLFKTFFTDNAPQFKIPLYKEMKTISIKESPSLKPDEEKAMIQELKEFVMRKVSRVD